MVLWVCWDDGVEHVCSQECHLLLHIFPDNNDEEKKKGIEKIFLKPLKKVKNGKKRSSKKPTKIQFFHTSRINE